MLFGKKKKSNTQQIQEAGIKSLEDMKEDAEVRALLTEGKKVKAIQAVREKTGVDLRTAKDFVEVLTGERQSFDVPKGDAEVNAHAANSSSNGKKLDDLKGDPEIRELLLEGKKVKAIQIVRAKTGVDLRTAKDFVESL